MELNRASVVVCRSERARLEQRKIAQFEKMNVAKGAVAATGTQKRTLEWTELYLRAIARRGIGLCGGAECTGGRPHFRSGRSWCW